MEEKKIPPAVSATTTTTATSIQKGLHLDALLVSYRISQSSVDNTCADVGDDESKTASSIQPEKSTCKEAPRFSTEELQAKYKKLNEVFHQLRWEDPSANNDSDDEDEEEKAERKNRQQHWRERQKIVVQFAKQMLNGFFQWIHKHPKQDVIQDIVTTFGGEAIAERKDLIERRKKHKERQEQKELQEKQQKEERKKRGIEKEEEEEDSGDEWWSGDDEIDEELLHEPVPSLQDFQVVDILMLEFQPLLKQVPMLFGNGFYTSLQSPFNCGIQTLFRFALETISAAGVTDVEKENNENRKRKQSSSTIATSNSDIEQQVQTMLTCVCRFFEVIIDHCLLLFTDSSRVASEDPMMIAIHIIALWEEVAAIRPDWFMKRSRFVKSLACARHAVVQPGLLNPFSYHRYISRLQEMSEDNSNLREDRKWMQPGSIDSPYVTLGYLRLLLWNALASGRVHGAFMNMSVRGSKVVELLQFAGSSIKKTSNRIRGGNVYDDDEENNVLTDPKYKVLSMKGNKWISFAEACCQMCISVPCISLAFALPKSLEETTCIEEFHHDKQILSPQFQEIILRLLARCVRLMHYPSLHFLMSGGIPRVQDEVQLCYHVVFNPNAEDDPLNPLDDNPAVNNHSADQATNNERVAVIANPSALRVYPLFSVYAVAVQVYQMLIVKNLWKEKEHRKQSHWRNSIYFLWYSFIKQMTNLDVLVWRVCFKLTSGAKAQVAVMEQLRSKSSGDVMFSNEGEKGQKIETERDRILSSASTATREEGSRQVMVKENMFARLSYDVVLYIMTFLYQFDEQQVQKFRDGPLELPDDCQHLYEYLLI